MVVSALRYERFPEDVLSVLRGLIANTEQALNRQRLIEPESNNVIGFYMENALSYLGPPIPMKSSYSLNIPVPENPLFEQCGASIPVVTTFSDVLKVPVILMGFGLPDDDLHAPNEKFDLDQFKKGIETITYFFELLAEKFGGDG